MCIIHATSQSAGCNVFDIALKIPLQVSFWGAQTHADIIVKFLVETKNVGKILFPSSLLQLKSWRSSKKLCGAFSICFVEIFPFKQNCTPFFHMKKR